MQNTEIIKKNSKIVKKGFTLSAEEVKFLKAMQKELKGHKHRDLRVRIKGVLMVGGMNRPGMTLWLTIARCMSALSGIGLPAIGRAVMKVC
jgi:hypothetical protein